MGDLASGKTMTRSSCAFALLAFALLAAPAQATDASVTFRCCQYTPNSVRILPGEKVTIAPDIGVAFENHPLHYTDDVGNTLTGTTPAERTFPQAGIYQWYCGIHGHYDGVTVSGMSGRVAVTTNHLPVASFTAGSTDVAPGTEVTFDASGSSDADLAQSLNYSWDLDGDGIDDPGQTGPTPSMIYTNTSSAPRQVTVRLTATDTNSDAVGPESGTNTMVITVEPKPAVVADTRAPQARITKAKVERTRVRVSFSSDEPGSVTAMLRQGHRKATVTRDFAKAGQHTITLRVTKKLRHRRVALTLAISDDAGNGTTLRRTLKLR
jgi:plastocyanin